MPWSNYLCFERNQCWQFREFFTKYGLLKTHLVNVMKTMTIFSSTLNKFTSIRVEQMNCCITKDNSISLFSSLCFNLFWVKHSACLLSILSDYLDQFLFISDFNALKYRGLRIFFFFFLVTRANSIKSQTGRKRTFESWLRTEPLEVGWLLNSKYPSQCNAGYLRFFASLFVVINIKFETKIQKKGDNRRPLEMSWNEIATENRIYFRSKGT